MEERRITEAILENYGRYLKEEERSRNTIEKYLRDIRSFQCFLTDRPVSRQELAAYKEELKKQYTIVIVTHNMQQAARVSDRTAFFYMGEMVEYGDTKKIFTHPDKVETQNYITGRFG